MRAISLKTACLGAPYSQKPTFQMSDYHVYPHVDTYLSLGVEYDCSDIHLATASPPCWRRFGKLQAIWDEAPPLTADDTENLVKSFLTEELWELLHKRGDADFAYQNELGRFRASVVRQRLGYDMVFRVINTHIRTIDELKLPKEHLIPLTRYHNGLLLVTGSVGSGKSTTMAAIIDFINQDREDHILTLEDPIEYVFESKGCHVNQREVHSHTESFPRALRGALREDPDIIVVGEMRNLETISLALTAAETGHLVIATLHTGNAPRTLDRILDVFPTDQRDQIRVMVAESLRGVISQQLIPNAKGDGRELALELLVNTAAVAACIRDGKTFMLPGIMQTGKNVGMITMDESIKNLYIKGRISQEEAYFRAEDKKLMKTYFKS